MSDKGKQDRASSVDDWEGYYGSRGEVNYSGVVDINDFRHYPHRLLIETIERFIGGKESVIEIGAGDSEILIDIARRFNPKKVYGLDYLETACTRLSEKSRQAGVNVQTVCADMFSPPKDMVNSFDFVMSYGVVEHFHDLAEVLRAIGNFVTDDGLVFTLIPNNKKTIYGWLMKKWNIDVYNAHVLYDLDDLKQAHKKAGLDVVWADYLVSSNFGMLSWCFKDTQEGLNFWIYKQLTRASKLFWFFESKLGAIKPTKYFAPYIVCVSRPKQ